MNTTTTDTDDLKKTFSDYLKSKNLRQTAEREAIFNVVYQTKGPFTPDAVQQQLEDAHFHVSRASVYNTIELLIDAQIVVRHQFLNSLVQYELKCLADNFSHIICTRCNRVQKVKPEKLQKYFSDYKTPKFTIERYSIMFYGICSKCKYRLQREEIKNRNKKQ